MFFEDKNIKKTLDRKTLDRVFGSVDFPLLSVKPDEVKFNGLTFKKISDDEMHILVVIDQGSEAKTVNFKCKRTPLK